MSLLKSSFLSDRQWAIVASIFMMATSAMGPGFLTQTAVFTVKLGAAFGFAILVSILIDYVVQQNIWRVVTLTQMRASDIANKALPGSGYLLAFLVILGGFFFSIGNIAGAALGLNALFGLDTKWGGILSGALAILIFASRKATLAMDKSMIVLGLLKIILIIIVAVIVMPPWAKLFIKRLHPTRLILPSSPRLLVERSAAISAMQAPIVYWIKARLALKILMKSQELQPKVLWL